MNDITFYPVTQASGSNVTLALSLPCPQITMLLTCYISPPSAFTPTVSASVQAFIMTWSLDDYTPYQWAVGLNFYPLSTRHVLERLPNYSPFSDDPLLPTDLAEEAPLDSTLTSPKPALLSPWCFEPEVHI